MTTDLTRANVEVPISSGSGDMWENLGAKYCGVCPSGRVCSHGHLGSHFQAVKPVPMSLDKNMVACQGQGN